MEVPEYSTSDEGEGNSVGLSKMNKDNLSDSDEQLKKGKKAKPKTKLDKMFNRKNISILTDHYKKLIDRDADNVMSEEEELITLKRADHELPDELKRPVFFYIFV